MQLYPNLTFDGKCEGAFKFYEECLHGRTIFMMTYENTPMDLQAPSDGGRSALDADPQCGLTIAAPRGSVRPLESASPLNQEVNMRRTLFWSGLLWLSLSAVLAAGQSVTGVKSQRSEKLLGTWKQLPPDQSTTLKIEGEAGGIKVSYGCKEDGSCSSSVVSNYDGRLSKYPDDARWKASFRKMADGTAQHDTYFHGKLDNTDKWQVSPDRNTLTVTNQVVNAPEAKAMRIAYDRRGGPASKNDPFIGFWKRNWEKSDPSVIKYTAKGDVFTTTAADGITDERDCDGKDHPNRLLEGTLYSCGFPDERTYELVLKDNGKVTTTISSKISEDGKKMARIVKNGEGKTMSELRFEKAD